MGNVLELKEVGFYYKRGGRENIILDRVSVGFEEGKLYAVLGRSGAGKTTLLSLLGALEVPKQGEILYRGRSIKETGEQDFRQKHLGMVFQEYNLLEYMTAVQNVVAAMQIAKLNGSDYKQRAYGLLEQVGIGRDKADSRVNDLSGGEQQRVAIARAIGKNADLLLGDEPTGNLDSETGQEIMDIFKRIAHENGKCVIIVTHSLEFAKQADAIFYIEDAKLKMVENGEKTVNNSNN